MRTARTARRGQLLRWRNLLAALLLPALALAPAGRSLAQTATPTLLLGVIVTEQNVFFPISRMTVCVSPDASEPAFWGRFQAGASAGLPGLPGVVWIPGIPVPPGMQNEQITVTVARQGYQDTVVADTVVSFLPGPGANPGNFTLRRVPMPRGGQTSGDCGTPPLDPLRPGLQIFPDPNSVILRPGDTASFKLHWSGHNFAAPWYLYAWEIGDTSIARAVASSSSPEIQIEAVAPGMTLLTPFLLRPDGTRKQGDSARIKVETTGPPPPPTPPAETYSFGWETPVDQRAATDFSLPHPCAVGKTLAQLVHSRSPAADPNGCSLRSNPDEGCSTCHRPNATTPVLRTISRTDFCDLVPKFDMTATKPANLKAFFNNWLNRQPTKCPD